MSDEMVQEQTVNVKDPSTGELGSIPASQLPSALAQGYSHAAPEEIDQNLTEQKYGTPSQQVIRGLEAAGESATFGLSTQVEKDMGVKPEDIRGRREANPGSGALGNIAGLVGSAFVPEIGAAGLLDRAGLSAAKAVGLAGEEGAGLIARLGSSSVRGATEMALMQAGDETSKALSGDPETTAQSAATNILLSGVMGGAGGAAIGAVSPLWKAANETKLGQMIEDFKGRIKEHLDNPNATESVVNELKDYHEKITDMADDVYGSKGLKAQEISKLMPETMTPKISQQAVDLSTQANDLVSEMQKKPNSFPTRLASKLQDDVDAFNSVLKNSSSPGEVFEATQDLKQKLQAYSKFDKFVKPVDEAYDFVQKSKDLGFKFRNALEDGEVWGKAAERQQSINSAFKEYLPALKDFEKRFTTMIGGEKVVDPSKINTYMNQLGKPTAEIKQEMLKNFIDASEKYKSVLADTHANLGLENPIPPSSLTATKQTLNELTPGAKVADTLIKKGIANVSGKALGALVGGGVGHLVGAGGIGALVGEHALGPLFSSILPSITKPLLAKEASAQGFKAAVDYGVNAAKSAANIAKATKAVFKPGAEVMASRLVADNKSRDKLDEQVKTFAKNPEGLMDVGGHTGHYFPAHAQSMGKMAANAANYLNSIRPATQRPSPLDEEIKPTPEQQEAYHRQLDVANQPLTVLQHIKDGTLLPQDMATLKTIYPALYQKFQGQLMDEMTTHLSKDEVIPYKSKMSLSLFLGQPLDSTMTPSSLMATQAMPVTNQQQQHMNEKPQGRGSMKNVNKLAQGEATPGQNREMQKSGMMRN